MVRGTHHQYRAKPALVAPVGKHATFVLASGYRPRDQLDAFHAKRTQLANGSRGGVFVGDPSAEEFTIDGPGRVRENGDSSRHPGVNEVGGFEHSGATCLTRHDDDVGPLERIFDDQRPTSGSQNGRPNRGDARRHDSQAYDRQ